MTARRLRRVDTQLISAEASLDFLRENRGRVATQTADAAQRPTDRHPGRAGTGTLAFAGADNMLPLPEEIDTTPPCAYRLTAAQFGEVRRTLALQGATSRPSGSGRLVPLGQPARSVFPLLLDERAINHVVEGDACRLLTRSLETCHRQNAL